MSFESDLSYLMTEVRSMRREELQRASETLSVAAEWLYYWNHAQDCLRAGETAEALRWEEMALQVMGRLPKGVEW